MNSKIKYYTTMGLYWSVIAACVSFLNVFLTGRGLGTAEIGFLTAVGNGLAAIFQPIVSKVCSRSNKNERDFLVLISMLAMTLVIMALERKAGLAMKIEIVAAIALVLVMQPLLNSLGYFYIARSVEINYGVSRGIGSITFAVTSFVLGILSEINKDLSMVMAAVLLGALILSLLAQKPISGNNLVTVFDGRAQKQKIQVGPKYRPITSDILDYDEVMEKFDDMLTWLAELYVNTLNIIHYMHDKYSYESLQMALHDRDVKRYFAIFARAPKNCISLPTLIEDTQQAIA